MFKDVIKIQKIDAENIIGHFLQEGLNEIIFEVKKNKCKLQVYYHVIVPSKQIEPIQYAFFDIISLNVTGRGTKKYFHDIREEIIEQFESVKVLEESISYHDNIQKKFILSGYKKVLNSQGEIEYPSVYTTILFVPFNSEETINCTDKEVDEITLQSSTEHHLNRYVIENKRYQHTIDIKMLFNQHIYKCMGKLNEPSSYTYHLTRDTISQIDTKDNFYIVDKENRVWHRVNSFKEENDVVATFKDLVVIKDALYSRISIFNNLYPYDNGNEDNYLLLRQQLYQRVSNARVIHLHSEGVPFIQTNLPSDTVIKGYGLYRIIEWNHDKYVIAPIQSCYIASSNITFDIVIINKQIYILVGKYDDIGFIVENKFGDTFIKIGVKPQNEYTLFCETVDELFDNLHDKEISQLSLNIFDEHFKKRKPLFQLNDRVRVTKELTEQSQLKGLEGTVIFISDNKEKVTVQFFQHFVETFTVDYLQRI